MTGARAAALVRVGVGVSGSSVVLVLLFVPVSVLVIVLLFIHVPRSSALRARDRLFLLRAFFLPRLLLLLVRRLLRGALGAKARGEPPDLAGLHALKEQLRERGLPVSGVKAVLIARLTPDRTPRRAGAASRRARYVLKVLYLSCSQAASYHIREGRDLRCGHSPWVRCARCAEAGWLGLYARRE